MVAEIVDPLGGVGRGAGADGGGALCAARPADRLAGQGDRQDRREDAAAGAEGASVAGLRGSGLNLGFANRLPGFVVDGRRLESGWKVGLPLFNVGLNR